MSGEELKPVAWMYRGHLRDILELERLPERYRAAYDSETPLYAHPLPEQPQEGARLSSTAALEAEVKLVRQQIEYLTGVPSAPGVINDYRDPEIDAAVLRCRERGDDETAQILARMRLVYREQKDSLTDEIASLKQRLEEARALLAPYAEAADDLDEKHGDDSDIWEATAAMSITAGDLRDARTWLAKERALQEQEKQNG